MSEPYIQVSDQEEDWKPVIKTFISEASLQGLLDIKKVKPLVSQRPVWDDAVKVWCMEKKYGPAETRIMLSEEAHRLGYTDPKVLFNDWFNKIGNFTPGQYDEPYYDPAADIL